MAILIIRIIRSVAMERLIAAHSLSMFPSKHRAGDVQLEGHEARSATEIDITIQ